MRSTSTSPGTTGEAPGALGRRGTSGRLRAGTIAFVCALVAGCTTGDPGAPPGPDAIKARYETVSEGGESGGVLQAQEVIAQGDRFRMSISDAATPDEVYLTVVWDGHALLLVEPEDASRQEDPPAEERPTSFILRAGDATFERLCPSGTREGSARIADRAGTVYSCPAHGTGEERSENSQITLDDATGLLLRSESASGHLVALEVEVDVAIDEDTFSTEIPRSMRGPEDGADGSGTPQPLTATDSVPLAGGGELQLAEIRHGPSLVVIGELAGVTAVLDQILPKSGQGQAPPVYVLLNPIRFDEEDDTDLPLATEEGTKKLIDEVGAQVADIPVPVGIDIKGGAAGEDLRSFDDIMAGTTVLAAIDESGALAWRMTDDDLARSAKQLDGWIAATSQPESGG